MVTNLVKSDMSTSHSAGVGRVRERTIVVGSQVIAIDNIGSIQIVRGQRNWLLFVLGLILIAGSGVGAMTTPAGGFALVGVGLGLLLIAANVMQRVESGLSIGTSDGRAALIVSTDETFLQRLLSFLVEKINTRDHTLVASFDITHNNFSGAVVADTPLSTGYTRSMAEPVFAAAPASPPVATAPAATDDADAALFGDTPVDSVAPAAPPPAPAAYVRDPLVATQVDSNSDETRDWLSSPGRIAYSGGASNGGGGARWILPVLAILLIGGGGAAAWMVFGPNLGAPPATPTATLPAPESDTTATTITAAEPADPAEAPLEEAVTPPLVPPIETPPVTPPAVVEAIDLVKPTGDPLPNTATDFSPPETMVARASGLRYRSQPSSADTVPVVAETRAGGEPLQINGRIQQPDGEWYRVSLPSGAPAWFKASLAVPRSRFAETFSTPSGSPQSFAAAAPRILEPAEGVQIAGGPQPVRLAWSGPQHASIYIVEIESYDAAARRWITDPQHRRATVDSADELAEAFPTSGAWRWRVRGVTPSGEQSQFSRWSAFTIRD